MVKAWIDKARTLLVFFPGHPPDTRNRSEYERFAIPYTFKPLLSFGEAVFATVAAVLRVLLGSLLFALWGAWALSVWSSIHSAVWRPVVLLPLVLLFLGVLLLLMIAISAVVRFFCGKPACKPQIDQPQ